MGMFDELRCSADIGELTGVLCQTKSIDNFLEFDWVDPKGYLWKQNYHGRTDYWFDGETLKAGPNGHHGRYTRCYLTRYISIYKDMNQKCTLHFDEGKLKGYKYVRDEIFEDLRGF